MKKIVVYQEGVENIELFDKADGDIQNFAVSMSNVLKASTVSIINVTSGTLIVRPSKVISIYIEDQSTDETVNIAPKDVKGKKPVKKVDIITDVD